MATILKRTVFYDDTDGYVRFRDWARVITNQGTMHEPFIVNNRFIGNEDFDDFDPEDEMARIDEIRRIDALKENNIYSGGGDVVNGGVHMPRVGK